MTKKETEEEKQQRELIEGIAQNISDLAGAVKSLLGGKLKRKAIAILLAHASGESQTVVNKVLDAAADLEKDWVNK